MVDTMDIKTFGPSIRDAYNGSFFTVAINRGDSVSDTATEIENRLIEGNIGKPVSWILTTGQEINAFANTFGEVANPVEDKQEYLMFPLDGLDPKIVFIKFAIGGRWFDDIVNNMTEQFI